MASDLERAREIFLHAVGRLPADRWDAYVGEACGGSADLAGRVRHLLRAHADAGSFLEGPAATLGAPADQPPAAEGPGTVVGPYKLLEQIGEGGFGAVFLAEQAEPVRRKVALKVLKPGMDTKQVVTRFKAERQALAIMDHPHIARVFDGGATPSGRPYFVMELVKGSPITDFCDLNHFPTRQRLELFVQVCQAVQHAHQKGVIHRDLKPSNVLVSRHDTTPVVKVIDFGVAKAVGQTLTETTLFTGVAQMVGTPLYMSPEQAGMSDLDVDTRSDVYSLGVLLYELLTGTTPFEKERFRAADCDEIRRIIREEEPSKPSTRISTLGLAATTVSANRGLEPVRLSRLVRGELDWIVMKALEKDRTRRYDTAAAFAADVLRYLADEPVLACPPSSAYRLRKFARQNRPGLAVAGLLLVFLVLLGSGVGWALRDRSAREARQQGERRARVAGQVESLLVEAARLESDQNWPAALAAVRQAEAAVAGGEADPATEGQVRLRLRDLGFVARLEQIRTNRGTVKWEETDRAYARAFRDYGVGVDELPAEASIERLGARPQLRVPLAAALDHWVSIRDRQDGRKRLTAVACGIDPDPLRHRLRSTWGQPISPEVRDELRRLARRVDVRAQHPETLVSLARVLTRAQEADSAVRLLRESQSHFPGDFWINYELGATLYVQKDLEGAIRFNTAAVSIRPSSATAHFNLGLALRSWKRREEAIACFRKAVELEPERVEYHLHLGYTLGLHGRPDEGTAAYEKALELQPGSTYSHYAFGCFLRDIKRDDKGAVAYFRKAIALDPEYASRTHVSSDLCQFLGQYVEREEVTAIIEALRRSPTDYRDDLAECLSLLAWDLATHRGPCRRDPGRAVSLSREAVELKPDTASYHNTLGVALYRTGDWKAAIETLEQADRLAGGNHFACNAFFIAMSQWHLGNKDEARRRYDQAAAWMKEKRPGDGELQRFRAEAAALLGVAGGRVEIAPPPRVRK